MTGEQVTGVSSSWLRAAKNERDEHRLHELKKQHDDEREGDVQLELAPARVVEFQSRDLLSRVGPPS